MPEGITDNLPPKNPRVKVLSIKPRVRVLAPENRPSIMPSLEQNIKASERFIRSLRSLGSYSQDPDEPQYLKSDLGFRVQKYSVERGFFDAASVQNTAEERYRLPLAIYIDRNHAQLVVKGAYQTPEGRKIMVYNPMSKGFQEISVNVTEGGSTIGVTANGLVGSRIARGEYDIVKFFEEQQLGNFRSLLTDMKAFNFQNDVQNCIPYCLFVNAMIHGLEPGKTPFKEFGRKQFEQDFGIRILTREEFLPKPRVRLS